jgi:hypothetical protein
MSRRQVCGKAAAGNAIFFRLVDPYGSWPDEPLRQRSALDATMITVGNVPTAKIPNCQAHPIALLRNSSSW